MIKVRDFIREVEKIAASRPAYKTGGTGKGGVCDCIGLIMGAMYELGRGIYDLHSTNYFARYQTLEMTAPRAFVGAILYKSRESTAKLNARYQKGGRYYTGDLLDYYHVGVVTGVNPLRIVECTEYGSVQGIKITNTLKGWKHGGKLRGVAYESEEAETMESYKAKVKLNDPGSTLNVRNAPGTDGDVIGKIGDGAAVTVIAESGEWRYVGYGDGASGYVSAKYLTAIEENVIVVSPEITIVDGEGNTFKPKGGWRVMIGGND